jgi:hypothetical protein
MWFSAPNPCVYSSIGTTHWTTNGSISKFHLRALHHRTFFNMFFNKISEAHYAQILPCFDLRVGVWLIARPIFLTFRLSFPIFSQHFVCEDYPILQLHISLDVCAHIPSTLWVSTSYIVFTTINTLERMMELVTPLLPLCEMLASMWDENNYMHFLQPHSTLLVDGLTLSSPNMAFTP